MRSILIIILITSLSSFGQEIKYNLMLIDPCTNQIEHALLYHLEKDGQIFISNDSIGTIYLTKSGKYNIESTIHGISYETNIIPVFNIDSLYPAKIYECLEPISHPRFIGYCCCEEKCNGFQQDLYNNGNIRISGTFKDGLAIGKLTKYYANGLIKEERHYNKKGILKKSILYDESGNIIK